MQRRVLVMAAVIGGCGADDYGPDFDNTVVYPGPCSSRKEHADGASSSHTYEYVDGVFTRVEEEVRLSTGLSSRTETTWRRNSDGSLAEIVRTVSYDDPPSTSTMTWTFGAAQVVVARGDEVWAVYDSATFEFLPLVGSDVTFPLAELGLIEYQGVPYTWSMEGPLLVRTSVAERSTYELDEIGRIVVIRRDLENDGSIDITLQHTFDGEMLVRKTSDNASNPWSMDWRYDAAGNVGTRETTAAAEPSSTEEYDYGCW